MFTKKILSDCEGAVLCQLLFQTLAGTQSLDAYLEPLLGLTTQRMQVDPVPIEIKKHLLGIFMAAMYYNAPLTLQFLESRQMTSSLIEEMCNIREKFKEEYEQRFFIVGLSKMLMSPTLPASLQPQLVRLLNELVETITRLHDNVTKRVKAQAEKDTNIDDDSDDEEEDDDSDDEEDSAEEEKSKKKAKGDKKANDEDEETKDGAAMDDDALGFADKPNGMDDESDDEGLDAEDNFSDDEGAFKNEFEFVSTLLAFS